MLILLLFAFISGLITILAPCIWPLLPIILSATTSGGKKKPLGITLGIITSFMLFTLTIAYIVKIIPFDPNILRLFAVVVIGFLGLTLIIPSLNRILEGWVSSLSGQVGSKIKSSDQGFKGGYITGFSLGLVWAPCAGPILATVATLAATQAVNLSVVLVTLSYVIGIGIPLFIFATLGVNFFSRSIFVNKYTGKIQQIFGVIMILTALAIFTNYDKVLQAKILDTVPSYSNFLYGLENSKDIQKQLNLLKNKKQEMEKDMPKINSSTSSSLPNLGSAPDFMGITKWLNVDKPLTLSDLKGKVVLVDFWTYTCINCIRTLPHVVSWYEKYKDMGFVVVGVHTPEFEFEKDTKNVQAALKQYKINYSVAQDNNYATWNAYNNHYWPAEYLIDGKGNIRRTHFGEGEYEETEKAIQELLKENGNAVTSAVQTMADETPKKRLSPETYLGLKRMEYFYPDGRTNSGRQKFILPKELPPDTFSLGGEWVIDNEKAVTGNNSVLVYNFSAQKVFLILRPPADNSKNAQVKIFLDDKLLDEKNSGLDVVNSTITVDTDRLYNLVDFKNSLGRHLLRLEFLAPGVSAFAFTFG